MMLRQKVCLQMYIGFVDVLKFYQYEHLEQKVRVFHIIYEIRKESGEDCLIYLDNAATTKIGQEVLETMLPFLTKQYGNPSSVYGFSDICRKAMEDARGVIAKGIGANPSEIYFTSGGTESDNWALKVAMEKGKRQGKCHMITSKIEHHAILHTCRWLEQNGCEVTYLYPDEKGIIHPECVEQAIRPDTMLVSVMAANNEVGTLQPLEEIGKIAHKYGVLFHTDAVQAFGHIPICVDQSHISMLSASAHKFHGPKGIGFLYVRGNQGLCPLLHGGAQERGHRAGTENVAGIVGMGKAAQMALDTIKERAEKEIRLRNHMIQRVISEIPYTHLNGDRMKRLPNNAAFSFQFVEGEALVLLLGMEDICVSSGSACSSGSSSPSHVLKAMGLTDDMAYGSLRLTLSEETSKEEVDFVVERLKYHVKQLRSQSAPYHYFKYI